MKKSSHVRAPPQGIKALYAQPPPLGTVGGRLMGRYWADRRDEKVKLVPAEDHSRSRRKDDEGKRLAVSQGDETRRFWRDKRDTTYDKHERKRSEENKGPEGEKKREDHEQDRRGDTKDGKMRSKDTKDGKIQDRRKDERKRSKDKKGPQEEKKK